MPLKIIDHNTPDYHKMVELRYQVLRKPLGLGFDKADLDKEVNDILLGFFDEEKLEACCILTKEGEQTVRLRQMAVWDEIQGKGYGRLLMNFAENVAKDMGNKTLTMHARKTAIGFYERLGYAVQGEEFEEVNIPHYTMYKKL